MQPAQEISYTSYITLAARITRISKLFWVDNFRSNYTTYFQCIALLLMMFFSSQMDVYQSYKFKDYLTALSEKDIDVFSENIVFLVAALFLSLPLSIATKRLEAIILLRWRAWTTGHFMKLYLSNKTYYKMIVSNNNVRGKDGTKKVGKVDNPDQRISADIETFTRLTFQYVSELVETSMRLVSFAPVLWEISPYLFVFLIIYSLMGTYFTTFFFGRRMAQLNFTARQLEADFRYSIVRIRDNAESIAFYGGEKMELNDSIASFQKIENHARTQQWWSQWLLLFRRFWSYVARLMPTIITATQYFEGTVEYGSIAQADIVFSEVKDAMFSVIDNFSVITSLYATVERLEVFLDHAPQEEDQPTIKTKVSEEIDFDDVTLHTPNYKRTLWKNMSFVLPKDEALLVVGKSGCGKSSLFRALARLWDSGSGTISAPAPNDFFILPQHPYAPLGSLRHLMLYPHYHNSTDVKPTDKEILTVLQKVNLNSLLDVTSDLDEAMDWPAILSLGEMQRVSFARLLLAKRKYALLDEATSALDLHNEGVMYKLLQESCPTFISISHRPSLQKFHQFVLEINDKGYQFLPSEGYSM
eukprot:Phypoly_transcript_05911.p1 GENE.Phypoly_transcript_05911~~Phypoly_transcript_05911.p1  ORF type:complete len:586 (+),score=83.37 Phypoly_transcript_05911:61-1818(+)